MEFVRQTADYAEPVNALYRNRFVWRAASYNCILRHTIPGCALGTILSRNSTFFVGRNAPYVDLFGDPDGLS